MPLMSKRGAFEQRAPGRPAAKPGTGEHSHTIYGRENQVSSVALPALFGLRVRAVCINIVLALGSTRSCTSIYKVTHPSRTRSNLYGPVTLVVLFQFVRRC